MPKAKPPEMMYAIFDPDPDFPGFIGFGCPPKRFWFTEKEARKKQGRVMCPTVLCAYKRIQVVKKGATDVKA